jgi:hypothetical protein
MLNNMIDHKVTLEDTTEAECFLDELNTFNKVIDINFENEGISISNKLGILYQVYLRLKNEKDASVNIDIFKRIIIGSTIVATQIDYDSDLSLNFFSNLLEEESEQKELKLKSIQIEHLSNIAYEPHPKIETLIHIFNKYTNPKNYANSNQIKKLVITESQSYNNYNHFDGTDKCKIVNDLTKLTDSLQRPSIVEKQLKEARNKFQFTIKNNLNLIFPQSVETNNSISCSDIKINDDNNSYEVRFKIIN